MELDELVLVVVTMEESCVAWLHERRRQTRRRGTTPATVSMILCNQRGKFESGVRHCLCRTRSHQAGRLDTRLDNAGSIPLGVECLGSLFFVGARVAATARFRISWQLESNEVVHTTG